MIVGEVFSNENAVVVYFGIFFAYFLLRLMSIIVGREGFHRIRGKAFKNYANNTRHHGIVKDFEQMK